MLWNRSVDGSSARAAAAPQESSKLIQTGQGRADRGCGRDCTSRGKTVERGLRLISSGDRQLRHVKTVYTRSIPAGDFGLFVVRHTDQDVYKYSADKGEGL